MVVDYCCGSVDWWTSVDMGWSLLTDRSFGSYRLWIFDVFDFACLLAGLGRCHLLRLLFPLAFISFFHFLWRSLLTCFAVWLALCFDLLRVDPSCSLCNFGRRLGCSCSLGRWALAVNPLGRLVIFQMLLVYVDCSGTVIPALWVPLDFSVVECTVVLHSGTSGRVITLFKCRSSANFWSPPIGVVAS